MKQIIVDVIVICSICNKEMDIKEWGAYNFWFNAGDRDFKGEKAYPAPHRNRSHPCNCGRNWLSSDELDILDVQRDEQTGEEKIIRYIFT